MTLKATQDFRIRIGNAVANAFGIPVAGREKFRPFIVAQPMFKVEIFVERRYGRYGLHPRAEVPSGRAARQSQGMAGFCLCLRLFGWQPRQAAAPEYWPYAEHAKRNRADAMRLPLLSVNKLERELAAELELTAKYTGALRGNLAEG